MTRVGSRVLCGWYGQNHDPRPAVGTAWDIHLGAAMPICLPCADRHDVPVKPYRQPVKA